MRDSADFAGVLRGRPTAGRSRGSGSLFQVYAAASPARTGQPARVGLIVSKAVGGAVVRNRVKRVLRAALAPRLGSVPAGTDLVVRAAPASAAASYASVAAELDRLLPSVLRRLGGSRATPVERVTR